MFFQKMRRQMKVVIIVVVVAMAGGLLWAGGTSLFGSRRREQPALATVATVNGEGITQYDLHYTFLNNLQRIEEQQGILPASSHERVKFQALQSLIETAIIRQEIASRNLVASDGEIAEELQLLIDLFPSVEDYKAQLELAGIQENVLKSQIAQDIQFKKLKREIIGDLPIEEWEIKEAYEEVRPSHILVLPTDETEEGWAEAEANAWEIHAGLNLENFAELAQLHSEDSSAERGGDIGYISRGQTVQEFEEVAFGLALDEISEPVRSQFGYHIIMLTDRKDAEGEEYEKVKPRIEDALREEKGQDDLLAWFEGVREQAEIIYTDYQMNAFEQARLGNYEDSIHYYRLAIEEQPTNGYLYASLANVYHELEDLEAAVEQYQLALEQFGSDYSLHMALGELYQEMEQEDEAVQAYLRASELAPNDIYTQFILYNNVNRMERYEDARIIEDRITAFQERQAATLELQKEKSASEEETPPAETPAEDGPLEEERAATE